ncbi:MAG: YbaB/EbfC family nucleoid-associated protein [Acidimicrobiales bacterium]
MTGGFELPDIGALMRQAQSLGSSPAGDERASPEGSDPSEAIGTAGGGAVTVTMASGGADGLECTSVHIDHSAIDPDDQSLVEDLVMVAINDAMSQVPVGEAGSGGVSEMLAGLSGLGAALPEMLAGVLPGLGASLPGLLAGAMEAFGLSPAADPAPVADPPTAAGLADEAANDSERPR